MVESGIYIGYWLDENNKVYAVNYCTRINDVLESKNKSYDSYAMVINTVFTINTFLNLKLNNKIYTTHYFTNSEEANIYAKELDEVLQTKFGVVDIGCFDCPMPKEVKLITAK